jgi:hypothetical protein
MKMKINYTTLSLSRMKTCSLSERNRSAGFISIMPFNFAAQEAKVPACAQDERGAL